MGGSVGKHVYTEQHPSYRFLYCYALRAAVSLARNRM